MLLTLADAIRERDQRAYEINEWTNLHELLALIFVELQVMRREALRMTGGVDAHKLPELIPIRRPGEPAPTDETPKARTVGAREFALLAAAGGGG